MAVLLVLHVNGCAGRRATDSASSARVLCLDGLAVDGGSYSVQDVLMRNVRTRRWLDAFTPGVRGPIVVVDDREVDGLPRLASIRAQDVRSIETMAADRAVSEFGARGRDGAIVVRTLTSGANADARPADPRARCHP